MVVHLAFVDRLSNDLRGDPTEDVPIHGGRRFLSSLCDALGIRGVVDRPLVLSAQIAQVSLDRYVVDVGPYDGACETRCSGRFQP